MFIFLLMVIFGNDAFFHTKKRHKASFSGLHASVLLPERFPGAGSRSSSAALLRTGCTFGVPNIALFRALS
jgi:hypothetical protein